MTNNNDSIPTDGSTSEEGPGTVTGHHTQSATGPREQMAERLPSWCQRLLTAVTGKAATGQTPYFGCWRTIHVIDSALSIVCGVLLGAAAVAAGAWPLAVAAAMVTTHGIRLARTVLLHHAAHDNLLSGKRANRIAGNFLGGATISQPYTEYRASHVKTHHGRPHMTGIDPTVIELIGLGLTPGVGCLAAWCLLLWAVLSPRRSIVEFTRRLLAQFAAPHSLSRYLGVAASAVLGAAAWILGGPVAFALAWFLPFVIGAEATHVLRLVGEHVYPRLAHGVVRGADCTQAIYFGAPLPDAAGAVLGRLWRWSWWTLLMFGHAVMRYLAYPADLPSHDLHHASARSNWARHAYVRRDLALELPLREVWGLPAALRALVEERSADLGDPGFDPVASRFNDQ